MFLTDDELATLTGRKQARRQIEALRTMGIPFRVNALGKPVVTKAIIEGRQEPMAGGPAWRSNKLTNPERGLHGAKAHRQSQSA